MFPFCVLGSDFGRTEVEPGLGRKVASTLQLQGTLEMIVLGTLVWGPRHGYAIARELRTNSQDTLEVEFGSLYPALNRLEAKGLVSSQKEVSDTSVATRPTQRLGSGYPRRTCGDRVVGGSRR